MSATLERKSHAGDHALHTLALCRSPFPESLAIVGTREGFAPSASRGDPAGRRRAHEATRLSILRSLLIDLGGRSDSNHVMSLQPVSCREPSLCHPSFPPNLSPNVTFPLCPFLSPRQQREVIVYSTLDSRSRTLLSNDSRSRTLLSNAMHAPRGVSTRIYTPSPSCFRFRFRFRFFASTSACASQTLHATPGRRRLGGRVRPMELRMTDGRDKPGHISRKQGENREILFPRGSVRQGDRLEVGARSQPVSCRPEAHASKSCPSGPSATPPQSRRCEDICRRRAVPYRKLEALRESPCHPL